VRFGVIYGTRPEAIKLFPLVVEMKRVGLDVTLICTGQHEQLLQGIDSIWDLRPGHTVDSTKWRTEQPAPAGLAIELTSRIRDLKLDHLIVQGDTLSAMAGALAGFSLDIPVSHVEAGLRSGNLAHPWPEEGYRRMIDAISTLHLAPTESSLKNLRAEGYGDSSFVTGNTVVDALLDVQKLLAKKPDTFRSLQKLISFDLNSPFILFTQHRQESFGEGIESVLSAILVLAKSGLPVIATVHPNPKASSAIRKALSGHKHVYLIEPLPYLLFVQLLMMSRLVISDSGGLQEECPTFGKQILITRIVTERPEIVECGLGHLVGYDTNYIIDKAMKCFSENFPLATVNPFGDGSACKKIIPLLIK
jgi:UDP-N-acetylglucosamine 2-epimerase (non-hydrolysing)